MKIYLLLDDWGYDGMHAVGVRRTVQSAKQLAREHARADLPGRIIPETWHEKDDILMGQIWVSVSASDRRYIIREMELE